MGLYHCWHPQHRQTTIEGCRSCRHIELIPADAMPGGAVGASVSNRLPLPQIAGHNPQAFVQQYYQANQPQIPQPVTNPNQAYQIVRQNTEPMPEEAPELFDNHRTAKWQRPENRQSDAPRAIISVDGRPAGIQDLYKGASGFLILSGPSLNTLNLELLKQRGIITMGVNNSPAVFRPHLWTIGDPPHKFHQSIWYDPGVLKIVPERMSRSRVRVKKPDGSFMDTQDRVKDCPGVMLYYRNSHFSPKEYLSQATINWGNDEKAAKQNEWPHVLNTMFAAVRIMHYLGIRNLYLLGCDFYMDKEREQNYAFPQHRTPGAVGGNNLSYTKLIRMFEALKPFFEKAGFNVYNCNPDSEFKVFPYRSFTEAVQEATRGIPQVLDTLGWYDEDHNHDKRKPKQKKDKAG